VSALVPRRAAGAPRMLRRIPGGPPRGSRESRGAAPRVRGRTVSRRDKGDPTERDDTKSRRAGNAQETGPIESPADSLVPCATSRLATPREPATAPGCAGCSGQRVGWSTAPRSPALGRAPDSDGPSCPGDLLGSCSPLALPGARTARLSTIGPRGLDFASGKRQTLPRSIRRRRRIWPLGSALAASIAQRLSSLLSP